MMVTPTCTNHCASCGSHFSSLEAFDRHRTGSFDDPDEPRSCELPSETRCNDDGKLIYEYVEGECRISDPPESVHGRIWTMAGSRQRAASLHA